jgi:hypothetical protein
MVAVATAPSAWLVASLDDDVVARMTAAVLEYFFMVVLECVW